VFRSVVLFILRTLLRLRYRFDVKGLEIIDQNHPSGMLFLPNHPALIDPLLVNVVLQQRFAVRPLVDEGQAEHPLTRFFLNKVRALLIPDLSQQSNQQGRNEVATALTAMEESLRQGDALLVYPAGRIYRSVNEVVSGSSAVDRLVKAVPDARVVLVRTSGLWGSRFSRAHGDKPHLFKTLLQLLPVLLVNGLFFMPKRSVTLEFVEDDTFPRQAERREINGYLEQFYNAVAQPAFTVPDYFWQGEVTKTLPEPPQAQFSGDAEHVPAATRQLVVEKIKELSGHKTVADEMTLADDLGLDSLAVMELVSWMNQEFSVDVENLEALKRVADCLLAARGEGLGFAAEPLKPVADGWFDQRSDNILAFRQADNLVELILAQAKKNPDQVIVADQQGGTKTWRQLLTGVLALQPTLRNIEEESVAIMLPASVAACLIWLAVVFSGKRPVMLNWTTGERNMGHALRQTGVKRVLTSARLMDKLLQRGIDVHQVDAEWLALETLVGRMGLVDKLVARGKGQFFSWFLSTKNIHETAAVLFTSGSEALPKSVPLSHRNILSNMDDMTKVIPLKESDRLLGMLPPFHSLGLSGTIVMPLCLGLRTVYYPNPTDGAILCQHVEAYRSSVLIGTPTFLAAIAGSAHGEQLQSLRMIFTGAEKCPDATYQLLAERCPQATVCEGYGVTECSPLVSVNVPGKPVPGTIGQVMPSMEYRLVHPETLAVQPDEEPGILVVRGPNVFTGYLENEVKSPFVELEGQQWYNTGDLVVRNDQGGLTFRGRLKRFVKLGGEMISLPAIEEVLASAFAEHGENQGDGPLFAVDAVNPDSHPELVLFSRVATEREQINALIREAGLSPLHNIRLIYRVTEIPLLGTGKTDYRALRESLVE